MLAEHKNGRKPCEEIAAVAGATTTKQLARRRSTSAESEASQQQRMFGQFWMYLAQGQLFINARGIFMETPIVRNGKKQSFGCDAARDYSRSVPPYPFLCRLRVWNGC